MHIFYINILIFFILVSSTCFELEGSSSGRRLYIQAWYGTLYMHQYKQYRLQPSTYKTAYVDACETTVPYLYIQPSS